MTALAMLATAAAFNLMCTGTRITGLRDDPKTTKSEPHSEEYRVDLGARRWCRADCRQTSDINFVSEQVLRLESSGETSDVFQRLTTINRESGDMFAFDRGGDFVMTFTGTCERRQFTGFPSKKF